MHERAFPFFAVANAPKPDHVVWAHCRFRPGCSANDLVLSKSAAVGLRGGERRPPQPRREAESNLTHGQRGTPGLTAVARPEGPDELVPEAEGAGGEEGHDDGSIALDDRLAGKPGGATLGLHRGTPGSAPVARRAHQEPEASEAVVELGVAVSVEGAFREARDQPGAVGGVVGDGRIAGEVVAAAADLGDPRQKAVRERLAGTVGGCPAYVGGAAGRDPATHLEGADDGGIDGEAVGLDLGGVLGARVRIGIGADANDLPTGFANDAGAGSATGKRAASRTSQRPGPATRRPRRVGSGTPPIMRILGPKREHHRALPRTWTCPPPGRRHWADAMTLGGCARGSIISPSGAAPLAGSTADVRVFSGAPWAKALPG
jgi:hypothetical protein